MKGLFVVGVALLATIAGVASAVAGQIVAVGVDEWSEQMRWELFNQPAAYELREYYADGESSLLLVLQDLDRCLDAIYDARAEVQPGEFAVFGCEPH